MFYIYRYFENPYKTLIVEMDFYAAKFGDTCLTAYKSGFYCKKKKEIQKNKIKLRNKLYIFAYFSAVFSLCLWRRDMPQRDSGYCYQNGNVRYVSLKMDRCSPIYFCVDRIIEHISAPAIANRRWSACLAFRVFSKFVSTCFSPYRPQLV